ncbi:hypothetical protein EYF80_057426 [Liparis tanakae]|uniref:Uncharacterized protein n=1 Tax=Liparis tanakae TaxID=230148 RepID=A0A4Z2EU88_9TELE|nr:hypothetical protein EYF80_057426 [Liparis tanakae]
MSMGTRLETVLFRWFAVHMTCEWPVRRRTDIIRHIHLHIKDEPDGRRNTTLREQRAAPAGLERRQHNAERDRGNEETSEGDNAEGKKGSSR